MGIKKQMQLWNIFDLIVENADTEAKVLSLSFFNFVEYKILRNLKYMPAKI